MKKIPSSFTPLILFIGLLGSLVSTTVYSDESDPQYHQKTKIIKHILKIVSWPPKSLVNNSLNVCLIGEFPLESSVYDLEGKHINHHKISVRTLTTVKDAKDRCQLIYVSKSESGNLKSIIDACSDQPILLLGDMDDFARMGGSMNFMSLNKVLALTINLESLKRANLILDLKAFEKVTIFPEEQDLDLKGAPFK